MRCCCPCSICAPYSAASAADQGFGHLRVQLGPALGRRHRHNYRSLVVFLIFQRQFAAGSQTRTGAKE